MAEVSAVGGQIAATGGGGHSAPGKSYGAAPQQPAGVSGQAHRAAHRHGGPPAGIGPGRLCAAGTKS